MKESVFRAYDIRGTVGKEFLLGSVPELAHAISYFFSVHYPQVKKIVVGYDSRMHSMQIKEAVVSVLLTSGFDVIDIGLCPSPVLYFALHTEPFDAGIMITASHNKKDDNGIKINVGKHALSSAEIQNIKQYFFQKKSIKAGDVLGEYTQYDIVTKYVNFLVEQFAHLRHNPSSFIVDCGNGTSGPIITKIIQALSLDNVQVLFSEPNGLFPHHDPNPHDEKNWEEAKKLMFFKKEYLFAIGIDGDADRMSVMTKKGMLLSGDQLLSLFVKAMLAKDKKPVVLYNVLASEILLSDLARQGASVFMVAVGNPIMRAAMKEKQADIGGETSGHFFFADRYFGFDDGIYAMMRFIELYTKRGRDLDAELAHFPHSFVSPEIRIPCPESEKKDIMHQIEQYFAQFSCSSIDGIRVCFDDGWLIIRPSNTESVLSIRFEAKTKEQYHKCMKYIKNALPGKLSEQFISRCVL